MSLSFVPMNVFCCYAHEDESYRIQLETHLSALKRQGLISLWYDRQISAGANWVEVIDAQLEAASIILLLMSADFLASDYCYGVEMQRAMVRHEAGEARVVPIVVRPCDWEHLPLASLQALPRDAKPISSWAESDEAWKLVAAGLRLVIEEMQRAFPRQHQRETSSPKKPFPSSSEVRNRARFLRRMHTYWIKGVLEPSLRHAAFIPLALREQPDAVEHPWHVVLPEEERSVQLFPSGTSITHLYENANGALLLLGEPGAGKTTLLLELTRDLLEHAELESTHLMPAVFHLSSWAAERPAFTEWLVKELTSKYHVPRKIGQKWVEEDQLLLLLDGLDEVAEEHRSACIRALNTYRQEHGFVPLVITSRSAEYQALATFLSLDAAMVIQPLTTQQIDEYLARAGEHLEGVRKTLRHEAGLQEMATTPLMLSLMTQAFQGSSLEELAAEGSFEGRRQRVIERYIAWMLRHRGSGAGYTSEQTINWLAWLAQQMLQRKQTVFYIERMQPDWLPQSGKRLLYRGLLALASGLIGGFLGGFGGESFGSIFGEHLGNLMNVQTLIGGLLGGLGGGLFGGYISERSTTIQSAERVIWEIKRLKEPGEHLVWALMGKRQRSWIAVLVALLLFVGATLLLSGLHQLQPGSPFSFLLLLWYFIGLSQIMLPGLSKKKLDERDIVTPNQGIWHSARHSLLLGMVIGLSSGLYVGLVQRSGVEQGLTGGFTIGLFAGLSYGGYACLQYILLRLALWWTGAAPWNYPRFLNSVVERFLLRQVGGGYIFAHQLLLEHFARLHPSSVSHDEEEQTPPSMPVAQPAHLLERALSSRSSQGRAGALTRRTVLAGLAGLAMGGGEMFVFWERSPHPYTIYHGHTEPINAIAWSPDSTRIASASSDQTVQVWKVTDGSHLYSYGGNTQHATDADLYDIYLSMNIGMSAVTWSPDGKYLASASNDGTISIRNASNGKEVPPSSGRPFQGTTVAWSPHDRAALALVFGDDVEIWDVTRGELIFVYPHKGATMLAWSSDGTHIASASFSGGEIQVWDIRYQRNVCTYTHASTVMAIAWSPDGRRIVSAGWATVQICNSANGKPLFTYHGHTQMVNAVAWSPDGTRIASAGNRNSTDDLLDPESYKLVHVWNATTGNLVFAYQGHATEVSAVAWSPNGKLIASAGAVSWDATVQIWSPGATA